MQEWDLKVSEEVKCKFYQIWDHAVVGSYERRLKRMCRCTLHQEMGEEEENGVKAQSAADDNSQQSAAAAGLFGKINDFFTQSLSGSQQEGKLVKSKP